MNFISSILLIQTEMVGANGNLMAQSSSVGDNDDVDDEESTREKAHAIQSNTLVESSIEMSPSTSSPDNRCGKNGQKQLW